MSADANDPNMSIWFSTYGILTAERVLEGFQIHLSHDELVAAIKNPRSIYYQLLRVPLKNVFNGIILTQVHDYQVYVQKVFIDFLVSGENDKEPGSPGEGTRDQLEADRTRLMELGNEYSNAEETHYKLIAESQKSLINLAAELQKSLLTATTKVNFLLKAQHIIKTDDQVKKTIRTAMVYYEDPSFWDQIAGSLQVKIENDMRTQLANIFADFNDQRTKINDALEVFNTQADAVASSLKSFRNQFYQLILHVNELIKLLPDYRPNPEQDAENRSLLDFDSNIGGQE